MNQKRVLVRSGRQRDRSVARSRQKSGLVLLDGLTLLYLDDDSKETT
jgi:hypothetical protein